MTRIEDIFITLSAIGSAGLLVYFINGSVGPQPYQNVQSQPAARFRRDLSSADNLDFCFEDCPEFFDDSFDDVAMFQQSEAEMDAFCELPENEFTPGCNARKKGKGKKNKKKSDEPEVDYSDLWKEAAAQEDMIKLNDRASSLLEKFHKKNPFNALAEISPEVTVRDFGSFDLSGPSYDVFSNAVSNGANDCSLDAANRVTTETQSVFFMFPQEIMYDSTQDQEALMASYKKLGVELAKQVNDGTKFLVGSYGNNGKSTLAQTTASEAGAAIDALQTKLEVPVQIRKGVPSLKVSQLRLRSFLGTFTAPAIRNKHFRKQDDGSSQSCQAFVVIHGLPNDYKDISSGELDIDSYNRRCNIVPIFVPQTGFEQYYTHLAASWKMSNALFSSAEEGFRGYAITSAEDINNNAKTMANHLTSFVCACESRSLCLLAKPAYVAEVEEEDLNLLTTAATTTEFTTTTFFTTEGTTEYTTTADFRGVEETTEEIPVDMRCCGYAGDLGAAKFDQNRQFCCNSDDTGFYASNEVC